MVNYYTDNVPFPAVYFSIIMNKSKWEGLPTDVQDAIMKVGGEAGSKFWGKHFFDDMTDVAVEKIKEIGKGDNIYMLPDEEREKWIEVGGKPVWDMWVKDMEAKGVSNAREILETAIELGK